MLDQNKPSIWNRLVNKAKGRSIYYLTDDDRRMVAAIHQREPELGGMKDDRLTRYGGWLATRAQRGESLDRILPDAFAAMREACKRVLSIRPYDSQVAAGLMMHRGLISQMPPGEGKAISLVFPVFLHALLGKGVHVLVNDDEQSPQDADYVAALFKFLGLSSCFADAQGRLEERRRSYAADITYVSHHQACLDLLHDRESKSLEAPLMRPLHCAFADDAHHIFLKQASPVGIDESTFLRPHELLDQYDMFSGVTAAMLDDLTELMQRFGVAVIPPNESKSDS